MTLPPISFHEHREACFETNKASINSFALENMETVRDVPDGYMPFFFDQVRIHFKENLERYAPKIGAVYAFGSDDDDQLGFKPKVSKKIEMETYDEGDSCEEEEEEEGWTGIPTPFHIQTVTRNIVSIASGGMHTLALTNDGHVYSWGNNSEGQCGRPPWNEEKNFIDDFDPIERPYMIRHLKDIIAVTAGTNHSLALSIEGDLYFFGSYDDESHNKFRPLPMNTQDRLLQHEMDQIKRRNLVLQGENPDKIIQYLPPPKGKQLFPIQVFTPTEVFKVSSGTSCFAAILSDGSVVTWGDLYGSNNFDDTSCKPLNWADEWKLAQSNMKRIVRDIACGSYHLLLVAADPLSSYEWNVFSCGRNNYGQLGLGFDDRDVTEALTKVPFFDKKNIAYVAAGLQHSLCLDISGHDLYSFGRSDYGQLGTSFQLPEVASFTSTPLPVFLHLEKENLGMVQKNPKIRSIACGDHHNLVVTDDGDLYTWGDNKCGQLGHGNHVDSPYPKKVGGIPKAVKAVGGSQHSVIVTE